jgi:hypothetical protein
VTVTLPQVAIQPPAAAIIEAVEKVAPALPVEAVPVEAVPVEAVPVEAVPVEAAMKACCACHEPLPARARFCLVCGVAQSTSPRVGEDGQATAALTCEAASAQVAEPMVEPTPASAQNPSPEAAYDPSRDMAPEASSEAARETAAEAPPAHEAASETAHAATPEARPAPETAPTDDAAPPPPPTPAEPAPLRTTSLAPDVVERLEKARDDIADIARSIESLSRAHTVRGTEPGKLKRAARLH